MERYNKEKIPPPFVDLNAGEVYLGILFDCGPAKTGAMGGVAPLEWSDMLAYNGFKPFPLDEDEARMILDMSAAYVRGLSEGESSFSIAPADRGDG